VVRKTEVQGSCHVLRSLHGSHRYRQEGIGRSKPNSVVIAYVVVVLTDWDGQGVAGGAVPVGKDGKV
jgi:hypothetical protein